MTDDLADAMIPVACDLACLVRDRDWDEATARLDAMGKRDMRDLIIVLAAMVPDDRPVGDLLAWMDESHGALLRRAHAKSAAYRLRGEPVPADVAELDREWDRNRKRAAARERRRAA